MHIKPVKQYIHKGSPGDLSPILIRNSKHDQQTYPNQKSFVETMVLKMIKGYVV